MAKAMWMAGLLIGTSTAVTTVIPRDLREGHAQECLMSVIGDVMNCTHQDRS